MYQNAYYDSKNKKVHIWDDKRGHFSLDYRPYAYKVDPNGDFTSLDGQRVSKTYDFRRDSPGHYEVDIDPVTRTLTDLYLDSDDPSEGHTVLTYDIEVEMNSGLPDVTKGENEITSIAYHDTTSGKYRILILDKELVLDTKDEGDVKITSCPTEQSLLKWFIEDFERIRPTIITGWNIDDFDNPYLYNRIKRVLGQPWVNRLSPIGITSAKPNRDGKLEVKIAGVSSLDYLRIYKRYQFTELPNYRLDTVGRIEIGRGKIEYDGNLDQLFKEDIEKFIEYNLVDVQIVVELDKKLQYIELVRGVCHIGHITYDDIYLASVNLDGALLCYLHRNKLVAINKDRSSFIKSDSDEENSYEGAFVKPPQSGRHKWVFDLDLTSLYPSIIMTLNVSPETKLLKLDGYEMDTFLKGAVPTYRVGDGEISFDRLKQMLDTEPVSISSTGAIYRMDTPGIIPSALNDWMEKRKEYRKLESKYGKEGNQELYSFYKKRQMVQKLLLNIVYGCLGMPSFRYYDKDNAEGVTLTGQSIIQTTARLVNHLYKTIVGGHPIEITLDTGDVKKFWPNQPLMVLRGDSGAEIKAVEILPGDRFQGASVTSRYNPNVVSDFEGTNLGEDYDHNIYIDTDSIFFSAVPIMDVRNPGWEDLPDEEIAKLVDRIAGDMQDYANRFYDVFAKRAFNVDKHRLEIKKEYVAKVGFWTKKKKKYAQWIVSDNGVPVDKLDIKGLDIKRSDFPKAFQEILQEVLVSIMKGQAEDEVTKKFMDFKNQMKDLDVVVIAKNSSVKNLTKYDVKGRRSFSFMKGTPAHVKSAIAYNDMLVHYGCPYIYPPMRDGDKIKWIYLTDNPFNLESIAMTGHLDPKEIKEFIVQYADYDKLFESELVNKVESLYDAMNWGSPVSYKSISSKFFNF